MDAFKDSLPSTPPWHSGSSCAGQTLDWLPTDTKESYERMIQDSAHREYFQAKGWDKPNAITYNINKYGFRCEEFEFGARSVVALGCSYTQGIGLPVETLWPEIVGATLDLEVYNLAWGGTSADTCFMLAKFWLPVLRPELVVMAAPPKNRFDIIKATGNPEVHTMMPNTTDGEFGADVILKHWMTNDRNQDLNNAKNKLAVQALCQNLGIPCLTYDAHEYFARSREEVEYARDYMHAGPRGHKMFAERILDDWRKKHA
jgi:lysophospholipase L1-like esterase